MRELIFLVFCYFILMNFTLAEGKGTVTNRIYHGEVAHKGQFPFVGYLSWGHLEDCTYEIQCAGSIIHKRWGLTANHCWLSYNYTNPVFTVGTIYKIHNGSLPQNKGVSREVIRFYLNNRFWNSYNYTNPDTGLDGTEFAKYDHALMSFQEALEYNEYIQPIRLDYGLINKVDKGSYIGMDVTIMGWGVTENKLYRVIGPWNRAKHHTPVTATTLRYTDTKTVNQNRCHLDTINQDITTDDKLNVCVSAHDQRTACYGDSGGPLVTKYKNKYYQIGVDSYVGSRGCGEASSVYSRVDISFNWMHHILALCGDNIFDAYENDTIGIEFQPMVQSEERCNKRTQKEYEIYMREQEEELKGNTSRTRFEDARLTMFDGNILLNLTNYVESPGFAKKLAESRRRAKQRGSVGKSKIPPVMPLPF